MRTVHSPVVLRIQFFSCDKFFGQMLCVSKCVFSSWSSCGLVCLVLDFWIVGNGEPIDTWTSNWIARNLCGADLEVVSFQVICVMLELLI